MSGKRVSEAVIRRMPRYYRRLTDLQNEDINRISSGSLGEMMGLTAAQIRQDLNCFGGFGQQGYGYNVAELRQAVGRIMDIDLQKTAVIIGAGNLAHALMTNFNFGKYGFRVAAAFDVKPELCGQQINGAEIRPVSEMERFVRQNKPDVAILTLPRQYAVPSARNLAEWGVRGIWNFTGADLSLELPETPIENVHFSESLMVLSYKLAKDAEK